VVAGITRVFTSKALIQRTIHKLARSVYWSLVDVSLAFVSGMFAGGRNHKNDRSKK
jgi:hypothetical protein